MSFEQIKRGLRDVAAGVFNSLRTLLDYRSILLFFGRDNQLNFGPVDGVKGEVKIVQVAPECYFRGEKLVATDDAKSPGLGTRVTMICVGTRLQMPIGTGGTLTLFFSPQALGNGMRWDICNPGRPISMNVEFLEDCRFQATIFGTAAE